MASSPSRCFLHLPSERYTSQIFLNALSHSLPAEDMLANCALSWLLGQQNRQYSDDLPAL